MKENQDLLKSYVTDMIATEKHILEAIERQLGDKRARSQRETFDILVRIESMLKTHLHGLERSLSTLTAGTESTESVLKKAVTTVAGAAAGLYDRLRTEDVLSRNLRDDYTALSLAAISYAMLHTTGLALKDSEVSNMALRHLHDITPLIVELTRVIPHVVIEELIHQGASVDPSVGGEAVINTQKAWSRGAVEEAVEEVVG